MKKIAKNILKYQDQDNNFNLELKNNQRSVLDIQKNQNTSSFFKKNFRLDSEWVEITNTNGTLGHYVWTFTFGNFPIEFIQFFSYQILFETNISDTSNFRSGMVFDIKPIDDKFCNLTIKVTAFDFTNQSASIKAKSVLFFKNEINAN